MCADVAGPERIAAAFAVLDVNRLKSTFAKVVLRKSSADCACLGYQTSCQKVVIPCCLAGLKHDIPFSGPAKAQITHDKHLNTV
jgi:hypothetical protein